VNIFFPSLLKVEISAAADFTPAIVAYRRVVSVKNDGNF
jgi:hypothetical protein